ncbi:protein THEM6-like [Ruditapes philippinarum]|uniref:protein THEM6-like n=1 Tax=Ruditapes philippinarum TaxID=129788 RepID=UPI00295BDC9E|nr:protein THEM6-like [Ruditapes philippinarum]
MNYTNIFLVLVLTFCVLWMFSSSLCLVFGLFVSLSVDIHAIWRNVLVLYFCKMRRRYHPKKITDSNILKVICLPTDVDTDLQLTSGRLLRECGFGQREFWVENFVEDAVERLNGKMKVEAYHLSYDTPIEMFETFKIIAVVIYWDDAAFYMKQTIVRNRDKKQCATILSRHKLTNVTTKQILNSLDKCDIESKPVPPDLLQKLHTLSGNFSKKQ